MVWIVGLIDGYTTVVLLLSSCRSNSSSLSLGMLLGMVEILMCLLLIVVRPRRMLVLPVVLLVGEEMGSLQHPVGGRWGYQGTNIGKIGAR